MLVPRYAFLSNNANRFTGLGLLEGPEVPQAEMILKAAQKILLDLLLFFLLLLLRLHLFLVGCILVLLLRLYLLLILPLQLLLNVLATFTEFQAQSFSPYPHFLTTHPVSLCRYIPPENCSDPLPLQPLPRHASLLFSQYSDGDFDLIRPVPTPVGDSSAAFPTEAATYVWR